MAHFVIESQSFTCTPTRLSTNGMNYTCLCLPSRSWFSFTDLIVSAIIAVTIRVIPWPVIVDSVYCEDRSSSKLPLSTWIRVTVSREGRDGALRVNDEEVVVGRSPGLATQLNLQARLYVGGLPPRITNPSSAVTTGFVGAIQRVRMTDNASSRLQLF